MSDSDTSNSDLDESWLDDITSCQNELELIVTQSNQLLSQFADIQRKIERPSICFQGKVQPFSKWLTDWEDEMKHDTFHNITWGQFLIEKLADCTDA